MIVFKEVRKDYLKVAVIAAVALWLVVMVIATIAVKSSDKSSLLHELTGNLDSITAAVDTLTATDWTDGQAMADLQAALPKGYRSVSYGSGGIYNAQGQLIAGGDSYLLLFNDQERVNYYLPLEDILTMDELIALEDKFYTDVEYHKELGNTYNNMFSTSFSSELTLSDCRVTGWLQGTVMYPQSLSAEDADGNYVTVFSSDNEFFDGRELVTIEFSSVELNLRDSGPEVNLSDNLPNTQKCDQKIAEAAPNLISGTVMEDTGSYEFTVYEFQSNGNTYYCLGAGKLVTTKLVKEVFLGTESFAILFILLAAAALTADKLARKKTGYKHNRES